ncbi:hypothetical protein ACMFMG_002354 [Clarireedia jacksonii]
MSEARNYAWKFMSGIKMNINQKVVANGTGNGYPGSIPEHPIINEADVQADTVILDLGDESVPVTTSAAATTSNPATTSAPPPPSPVVTLPPDPKNCNCNESGCTKESPSCCAKGTC